MPVFLKKWWFDESVWFIVDFILFLLWLFMLMAFFSLLLVFLFLFFSWCKCHLFLSLQVPRNGGIKKGWVREYMVICDFKLFLYEIPSDKTYPSQVVQQVIDMRWVNCIFILISQSEQEISVHHASFYAESGCWIMEPWQQVLLDCGVMHYMYSLWSWLWMCFQYV